MLRTALRPRWLGLLVVALALVVLGIVAGFKNVMVEVKKIQKADAGEQEKQGGDDEKS